VAGYGAFGDQAVHLLDLVSWITGSDLEVVASVSGRSPLERTDDAGRLLPSTTEDFGEILLFGYATGLVASIFVTRTSGGGRHISINAEGSAGQLWLRIDPDSGRYEASFPRSGGDAAASAFPNGYPEWVAQQARGEPLAPSLAEGLTSQRLLDAARESARLNGPRTTQ
jgi:predicted dehydrogenase